MTVTYKPTNVVISPFIRYSGTSAYSLPPTRRFFLRGVFADEKNPSGSASIDASQFIFQSAASFQIRFVAKRQTGTTRLFNCTPAVKSSEFTEHTLKLLIL